MNISQRDAEGPAEMSSGGVTFTGSVVAFFKLAGKMSSRPLSLPGRHIINGSLLGANVLTMAAFVTAAPAVPAVAAAYLGANAILSFIKGFTTTAAIGGADMRKHRSPGFGCSHF